MKAHAHGLIARDRSDDGAKHAVSLSEPPQSDRRWPGRRARQRECCWPAQRVLQESNGAGTAVQHAAIWCSHLPDTAAIAFALVIIAPDNGQVEQALGSPWP
jgi:hypothetical protein